MLNNPTINAQGLKPFKYFCMTIGSIPSSYMEAMSYQELLMWFCDYLKNKVIPTVNNNAEAVTELQNLYIDLKNYVDNYFNNLDVQNQIDIKLDKMVTDGTLENIINSKIFGNINQELINLSNAIATTNQLINQTKNELNNSISSNFNTLDTNKIDKNGVEQVQYSNLSQEIKEKFTGGNTAIVGTDSVSTSNIVNRSITPLKLSFANVLNKIEKITTGYNQYQNKQNVSADYCYTDKIEINPELDYVSLSIRFADFYTAENEYISGFSINNMAGTSPFNLTSDLIPGQAKYIVISYNLKNYPDNYFIEKDLINAYNLGKFTINDNIDINILKNAQGSLFFNNYVKNLDNEIGYIEEDGHLANNSNLFSTPFLPVLAGDTLIYSTMRTGAFYDKNLKVVEFINNILPIAGSKVVPEGAKYFRGSFSNSLLNSSFVYHQSYIDFIEEYVNINVSQNETVVALPKSINIPISKNYELNLKNIFGLDNYLLDFDYKGSASHYNYNETTKILTLNSSETANESLTINVYNEIGNLLISKTMSINFINQNVDNKTVLAIGDSTIAQAHITNDLLTLFNNKQKTLTLLGTKGEGNNKYEGFAGGTLNQLANQEKIATNIDNPFYNVNGFDFSYYMNNNSYSSVDTVILQFGINDVFALDNTNYQSNLEGSNNFINNLNKVITSIKAFDNNIDVIVNLIFPPNMKANAFNSVYKFTKSLWSYNLGVNIFNNNIIDKTLYTLCPTNLILNATTDILDGVHPNENGYQKVADILFDYINL